MAIRSIIVIVCLTALSSATSSSSSSSYTVNVVSLGARPDGTTDSSAAFAEAWSKACESPSPAAIVVPLGRFFLKKAVFSGPCRSSAVTFQIAGTLVAPSDYNAIGSAGNWILFSHVDGVAVSGGVLDGQGSSLWSCKLSGNSGCPSGATASKPFNS